jgi:alanine racemase
MLQTEPKKSKIVLPSQKNTTASSWVEIDQKALEHNIQSYKAIIGLTTLAPVVKSNAYGHGIELIAKLCDQNDVVGYLCVVSLHEALFLRSIGIKKPLLVLSIIDGNLKEAIEQDIDLIAYDLGFIQELNNLGKQLNKKARVHLKVDTGLSRLGLPRHEALNLTLQTATLPQIFIVGIFTHFAESGSADQTFTNQQLLQLNTLTQDLQAHGITIPLQHAACTAAITANAKSHGTLVRLGIGTYGLWPSPENKLATHQRHPTFSLKPVLTWKTKIIQIKDIPAESYIGYDRTHQVHKASRIAILPVGYWDGYDRGLSNKGVVVIKNQLAPVLGRIAMNLTIVDITGLNVCMSDEVILLGNYLGVTAEDLAMQCNTINYEIVTRINPLLPRYLQE